MNEIEIILEKENKEKEILLENEGILILPRLQSKEMTLNENGTYNIKADDDYDGLKNVDITINAIENLQDELSTYNEELTEQETKLENILELLKNKRIGEVPKYKPRIVSFRTTQSEELQYEIENLDTSLIENFSYMFYNSPNLQSVDISSWDTSAGNVFTSMFASCKLLETVDLTGIDTSNSTAFNSMFSSCEKLKNIIGSEHIKVTDKTTLIGGMFNGCKELEEVDVSNWDVSNCKTGMSTLFKNCNKLKKLNTTNWDTSQMTDFGSTNDGCFMNCYELEELDVSNWDVSNVNSFAHMFENCKKLKNLDMSKWQNNKATSIRRMFYYCNELESADLSWVNVENNNDNFKELFMGCKALKTVKMFPYNASIKSYGVDGSYLFANCSSLEEIDLSNWSETDISTLHSMFLSCTNLKRVNLSNLQNKKITVLNYMFEYCSKLERIDIRNFTFDSVTNWTQMFRDVPVNCLIIVKDDTAKTWITSKFTTLTNVKTVAELGEGE